MHKFQQFDSLYLAYNHGCCLFNQHHFHSTISRSLFRQTHPHLSSQQPHPFSLRLSPHVDKHPLVVLPLVRPHQQPPHRPAQLDRHHHERYRRTPLLTSFRHHRLAPRHAHHPPLLRPAAGAFLLLLKRCQVHLLKQLNGQMKKQKIYQFTFLPFWVPHDKEKRNFYRKNSLFCFIIEKLFLHL